MKPSRYSAFRILVVLALLATGLQPVSRAQQSAANEHQFQTIARGVEYLQLMRRTAVKEAGEGPWLINALRIDLNQAKLQFVHALDEGVGLETVSSLAARYGAVAAINGGYFRTTGTFRGDSIGTLMLNKRLISEPNNERASVGLLPDGRALVFGHLRFAGRISSGANARKINGLNRPVADGELVIFTPEFHRTTLTPPDGVEVTVRNNRILSVHDKAGSSPIPSGGYIISAVGDSREWVLKKLRRGMKLSLSMKLEPVDVNRSTEWSQVEAITAGGPQLIKEGRVSITHDSEKINAAFVNDRHPRTAIAKLKSGRILLLTVDGRQPEVSVGMSLPGLAELLLEFGAVEAINLDGGGSTTMVVKSKIVNRPSDQTGERPISDAVLVYSKPQ
jgi:exopolysaccharide biosynthesis protein